MSTTEENLARIYTINFGKAWLTPQYKRTDRVVNMIKEFAKKHMKSNEIKLDQELNRQVWTRGRTNPPRRLRVRMVKDEDGIVFVSLYEESSKDQEKAADLKQKDTDKENTKVQENMDTELEEKEIEADKKETKKKLDVGKKKKKRKSF